jgi:hypothetical protein
MKDNIDKKDKNQLSLTKKLCKYFIEWSLNSTAHGIPMVLFYYNLMIYN